MINNFIFKVDDFLLNTRKILTILLFEKMERFFMQVAGFCTPISAIFGSLIIFVLAIKQDSLQVFLFAFLWMPLVFLCYYIGFKMQSACAKTLINNPSTIANQEVLDVFAVVGIIIAISSVSAGFFYAIKFSSFNIFLLSIMVAVLQIYSAWIALQPTLIATNIQETSTGGMDLVAILAMGNKIYLRLANLIMGVSAAVGMIILLYSFYLVLFKTEEFAIGDVWSIVGFITVVGGLLAPYLIYIFFIFVYLILDILKSILMMPKSGEKIIEKSFVVQDSPPRVNEGNPAFANYPSPISLKLIGIIFVSFLFLTLFMTKGREWYDDYQIRSQISRIDREQRVNVERERVRIEQVKLKKEADYISNAKQYVGKQSIDLLLNDEIYSELNAIVGKNISVLEDFFEKSEPVLLVDNLVMGAGCQKEFCDDFKGLLVVDLNQFKPYVVLIVSDDDVRFVGIDESEIPATVRRWMILNR